MKVAVIGAAGHIGKALCRRLKNEMMEVDAFTKTSEQSEQMDEATEINPRNFFDVSDRVDMHNTVLDEYIRDKKMIDAVIYCVGHCLPGGFLDAIKHPMSQYPIDDLDRELDMHIRGPFNVFQEFLPFVHDGGRFVFMSSAATRLLAMPREQRPPIHIYHHLAAIAAGDALIEGMRMDPELKKRGIMIDRIMPPAVSDSPFHQVEGGPKLPVTVTTAQVVDAIVSTLIAPCHQDVMMVLTPAK